MRSRKEIRESFKDIVVPAGQGHIKIELELLLDIRELLLSAQEARLLREVVEERKRIKEERESIIREE